MTESERDKFYILAAVYLDLDSDEVDDCLAASGLSSERDSFAQCRHAVKQMYPDHFERGRQLGALLLSDE